MRPERGDNDHVSKNSWKKLYLRQLPNEEKIAMAEHIQNCDVCATVFAEFLEKNGLLNLPPQFSKGVDKKRSAIRLTATPLSSDKGKREANREYRRYSCKVAIAACIALLLLFSGTFSSGVKMISKSKVLEPDFSTINQITQDLSDFSKKIINWI